MFPKFVPLEKSILQNALEDYAILMRTMQIPNADDRIMPEKEFLNHPDISETRKFRYLRTMGMIAELKVS